MFCFEGEEMTNEEREEELIKMGALKRRVEVTQDQRLTDYMNWGLEHRAIDRLMEAFELFKEEFPGYCFEVTMDGGGYITEHTRYKNIEICISRHDNHNDYSRGIVISKLLNDDRFRARLKELGGESLVNESLLPFVNAEPDIIVKE